MFVVEIVVHESVDRTKAYLMNETIELPNIVIVGGGAYRPRGTVSKPTYGMGCCVRRDNRETKIFWSIKESDFARLVSFPSSSRRERISMMISSCT